jgi:hypothetical protein
MVVCCDFLNYITYLRPNIFQDRFLSVKRNKYKYLYFFILFIIVIEYYIPTGIIYNFSESLEESVQFSDDVNNFNVYTVYEIEEFIYWVDSFYIMSRDIKD